jgi:hypothetical protein
MKVMKNGLPYLGKFELGMTEDRVITWYLNNKYKNVSNLYFQGVVLSVNTQGHNPEDESSSPC